MDPRKYREKNCDYEWDKDFLDITPKAGKTFDKLDFIKIKDCSSKHTGKGMQRQAIDYEKILANHMFEKDLYLEYIKTLKTQ